MIAAVPVVRVGVLRAVLVVATAVSAVTLTAQPPMGARGGMPGMPGMPGMQEDRQLVAQFDADKNGRLDAAERKAARAWMATQPLQGPGGMRPGGRGNIADITPGVHIEASSVTPAGNAPVYDTNVYRTFFLRFENSDWERELEAFNNTDVEVPAQVVVDGKRFQDVGVHFRGNSSYFMVSTGQKRSLNLSLDFVVDSQQLGGYRSFNLLNAANDPTFVRTVLYSQIANRYLPAPKVNFVRVVINGENWGTYVSAQQFNKDFLRDVYATTSGARWHVPGSPGARAGMEYLGDSIAPYKAKYEIKTKDAPARWHELIAMFRVLNETPADKLEAALAPLLDIDETLRFLAVDNALVNSDGYWTRASDYNIYQDTAGRFHVIPHDMNEAFGGEGGGPGGPGGRGGRGGRADGRGGPPGGFPDGPPPGGPPGGFPGGFPGGPPPGMGGGRGGGPMMGGGPDLDPLVGLDNPTTPLRSKLLAVPALRARYLGYVRQIAERDLDWATLGPLVAQYQRIIADDVKRDTRKLYSTEAFTTGVAALKEFADKRRAYLLEKLPAK